MLRHARALIAVVTLIASGCDIHDTTATHSDGEFTWEQFAVSARDGRMVRSGRFAAPLAPVAAPDPPSDGMLALVEPRAVQTEILTPDGSSAAVQVFDFDGSGVPRSLHVIENGVTTLEFRFGVAPHGGQLTLDTVTVVRPQRRSGCILRLDARGKSRRESDDANARWSRLRITCATLTSDFGERGHAAGWVM